ncbi:MAG: O-antigen ligase family protein [Cyanobacteria bacterium RM1_2_2]|nr:O-antigen ligase family protein [Cyanobacteria bacterium RM1_2_2]
MKPQNFEERVVWYTFLGSYPLYLTGLIFIVNTTMPWFLLLYLLKQMWHQTSDVSADQKIRIPAIIWLWIVSMIVMLIAILIGLVDFGYDIREIIRSSLNWARDWALFAILPLLGYGLQIRPQLIYRAACNLCLQSLFIIPICCFAYFAQLPNRLYSSPLERLTQNGQIYYNVELYIRDADSGGLRLALFTPWAPALGLISCVFFIFALQETNKTWKWIGLIGSIVMLAFSVSRGAYIFLPITLLLIWGLQNIVRPAMQIGAGLLIFIAGLFSAPLLDGVNASIEAFKNTRRSSSNLRAALERTALERWTESPIWGHGKQIQGAPVFKEMPIGSHHTWFGLLFTQGIVGFLAFAIPLASTIILLAIKMHKSRVAKVGLSVLLLILLASMSDNTEKLAYIYWSGLLTVGIALKASPDPYSSKLYGPEYNKSILPSS